MRVCLGQAAGGQRSRPKEAGCFLQRAGGPAGGEGRKSFAPHTNLKPEKCLDMDTPHINVQTNKHDEALSLSRSRNKVIISESAYDNGLLSWRPD